MQLDECTSHNFLCCDECGQIRHRDKFQWADWENWQEGGAKTILCKSCNGTSQQRSLVTYACSGALCRSRQRPEYHFCEDLLTEKLLHGLHVQLQCARCFIRSDQCDRRELAVAQSYQCVACRQQKPINDFAPVAIRDWLAGRRKAERWRCYDCQYPECANTQLEVKDCLGRAMHAVPHNALVHGQYYCENCRYPPCSGTTGALGPMERPWGPV